MPNIIIRALSGAVYVALIAGCLLLSPRVAFPLLMLLFALLGAVEYTRLTGDGPRWVRVIDIVAAGLPPVFVVCVASISSPASMMWTWVAASLVFVYPALRLGIQIFLGCPHQLEQAAMGVLGMFYIGMPLAAAAYTAAIAPALALLMFVMIWLNDTGAYLVGCRWGRTKLYERISPKKTWEGAAGGALFSMAAGVVAPLLFPTVGFGCVAGMLLGLAVCVTATIGDLAESMMKREEGVKDSGRLIPGHGGILDRIDSLLFVAPVTLLFAFWLLR